MRASSKSFSVIGAFLKLPENISLSGQSEPEALVGARVSANFLDVLNVKPLLGRSFLAEEDAPGSSPAAMISASLWRRRFQGDPRMVGKTATLNAMPHTIIGVLPENFAFPFVGTDIMVCQARGVVRYPTGCEAPRYDSEWFCQIASTSESQASAG
jgi:hypothetical protein